MQGALHEAGAAAQFVHAQAAVPSMMRRTFSRSMRSLTAWASEPRVSREPMFGSRPRSASRTACLQSGSQNQMMYMGQGCRVLPELIGI